MVGCFFVGLVCVCVIFACWVGGGFVLRVCLLLLVLMCLSFIALGWWLVSFLVGLFSLFVCCLRGGFVVGLLCLSV